MSLGPLKTRINEWTMQYAKPNISGNVPKATNTRVLRFTATNRLKKLTHSRGSWNEGRGSNKGGDNH